MAPEVSTPNPIIIEPPLSPEATSSGSLASSPDLNSFSNSPNSSRPQSQYNSDTSQSDPPSPLEGTNEISKNVGSQHPNHLLPSTPPAIPPLPSGIGTSVSPSLNGCEPPRSVPPSSSTGTANTTPASNNGSGRNRFSSIRTKITRKRWVESTIGLLGLVVAIWLGVRGYKLAVWQSWNDLRQTCAAYKQSGTEIGPRCRQMLEQADPPEPPYWLGKWASANNSNTARTLKRRESIRMCENLGRCYFDANPPEYPGGLFLAVMLAGILLFGGLLVWQLKRTAETEEVCESAAKTGHSDVQLTRHHDDGAETVHGQGVVIKQTPEDEDYPRSLRHRLRHSQDHGSQKTSSTWDMPSYNSSAETLINPLSESEGPSKVSLHDHSANEKHEGLIELDVAGKRKAFFKPSTGEFIHLAPWKSTHSEDEDSDDDTRLRKKATEKNSIHRAIGQMVGGGVSWAVGKKVDKKLAERLENANDQGRSRQPPQRAGDCLAGEVTNEWPSGRPTTI